MVLIFGNENGVKTGSYWFVRHEPWQKLSSMIEQVKIAAEEMLYSSGCFDGAKINL